MRLGDTVICLASGEKISKRYLIDNEINYIICFGYGQHLDKEVFSMVPCINIHTGYLLRNNGPYSYIWDCIDNTPCGVSIHYISNECNIGDIIAQKKVFLGDRIILRNLSATIFSECKKLFEDEWPRIRSGMASRVKQKGKVIHHTLQEQKLIECLYENKRNTETELFCVMARKLLAKLEPIRLREKNNPNRQKRKLNL
jgi:methionyl-tRNA formyltransferase